MRKSKEKKKMRKEERRKEEGRKKGKRKKARRRGKDRRRVLAVQGLRPCPPPQEQANHGAGAAGRRRPAPCPSSILRLHPLVPSLGSMPWLHALAPCPGSILRFHPSAPCPGSMPRSRSGHCPSPRGAGSRLMPLFCLFLLRHPSLEYRDPASQLPSVPRAHLQRHSITGLSRAQRGRHSESCAASGHPRGHLPVTAPAASPELLLGLGPQFNNCPRKIQNLGCSFVGVVFFFSFLFFFSFFLFRGQQT